MSTKKVCAYCNDRVYPIDALECGEKTFHINCFKCVKCKAPLNLGNYKSADNKIFCSRHYKDHLDTNKLSQVETEKKVTMSDESEQKEEKSSGNKPKCPTCSKTVYTIDALPCEDVTYHISCFKCVVCKTPLNLGNYKSLDQVIYCVSHYNQKTDPSKTSVLYNNEKKEENTEKKELKTTSNKPKCPTCGDAVYPIDSLVCGEVTYHETCFKCADCKTALNLGNYKSLEGQIYCVSHYNKRTDPSKTSVLYNNEKKETTEEKKELKSTSNKPKCPTCGDAVYLIDKLECGDKVYHQTCFKCVKCKTALNLGNYKSLDGVIYCVSHYLEQSNPHKVSEFKGTTKTSSKNPKCAYCGESVFLIDKLECGDQTFHQNCFKCCKCKTALNLGNYKSLDGQIYCVSHYKEKTDPSKTSVLFNSSLDKKTESSEKKNSDRPKCPMCSLTVYITDKLDVDDNVFHPTCFKCYKCKIALNLSNYKSFKGSYYCSTHYKEVSNQ